MNAVAITRRVGPCDSPTRIRAWIDELLETRLALRNDPEVVREVDRHLRLAAEWLAAWKSGRRCA